MVSRRGIPGGWITLPLAAWSVLMLVLWSGGRLDLYLHPSFRPLVGIAGMVLALMTLGLCFLPGDGVPLETRNKGGMGRQALGLFVLVFPAYAAAILSPQGYSLSTIMNRGISRDVPVAQTRRLDGGVKSADDLPLPQQGSYSPVMAGAEVNENSGEGVIEEGLPDFFQYIEKSPLGAWRLEMLDLVYAAQTNALRKKLTTEKIEITGQVVTKTPGATAEQFSVVRLLMTCCAADARPVGVWVERKKGAAGFQEMDWVRVTGRPTFPVRDGRRVVVIEIEHMEAIPPPEELFIFQ